jgi:hypothetical protein
MKRGADRQKIKKMTGQWTGNWTGIYKHPCGASLKLIHSEIIGRRI